MNKLILHLRAWNIWRKCNCNSKFYKFLVLIGFMKSPSMIGAYCALGISEGLKRFEKNPTVEIALRMPNSKEFEKTYQHYMKTNFGNESRHEFLTKHMNVPVKDK